MRRAARAAGGELALSLLLASAVSLLLYGLTVHHYGQLIFTYLPWNLFLAWIPLFLAGALVWQLDQRPWSSWPTLILSLLWLIFLPNSFYMVTDFIHLGGVYRDDLVLAAVVFSSFVFTGLLLGYSSLYLVHQQLRRRLTERAAFGAVAAVLALCSLAIYIGRDLRWNSWDVLANLPGLLFDISDRLLHPSQYGTILSVAVSFFILLLGLYAVLWRLAGLLQSQSKNLD